MLVHFGGRIYETTKPLIKKNSVINIILNFDLNTTLKFQRDQFHFLKKIHLKIIVIRYWTIKVTSCLFITH
ncbi:hypothetical protein A8M58_11655 [Yersinia pestis]|nr:hypothetical protein A8M58_11655 [Yersinia pestis]